MNTCTHAKITNCVWELEQFSFVQVFHFSLSLTFVEQKDNTPNDVMLLGSLEIISQSVMLKYTDVDKSTLSYSK